GDTATVRKLPEIVPGYHADILSIAVHPKVDRAIRLGHYVPYSYLTPTARAAVNPQDNDSLVAALTADRSLDRSGEHSISVADWIAAGQTVVKLVRTYHGETRASALETHHRTVTRLAALTDWHAAFLYDTAEREMAAADPQHDLGTRNSARQAMAVNEHFQRKTAAALAQQIAGARQPPQQVARRPAMEEPAHRDGKRARQNPNGTAAPNRRFRCGGEGHLPKACTATTTTTGRPVAPLSTTSRSPNALTGPNGRAFCFAHALQSVCRDRTNCAHYHGCSICGGTNHGAALCTAPRP
ncbi:hypothetical protein C8Q70DRAFT_1093350, partial [Cubamyces menziesii]